MYCTRADIEAVHGARHLETLVAADVDLNAAVAAACQQAAAQIDGYIARRYQVPLVIIPALVKAYAIDIACWRLSPSHDRLTEEIEKRAKAAIDFFKDVAMGKASIAELEKPAADAGLDAASGDGAAFSAGDRVFAGQRHY